MNTGSTGRSGPDEHRIDLGGGWTLDPIVNSSHERVGFLIHGPAAPECPYPYEGRCGGAVYTTPVEGRPCWKIESEEPLTLSPSIKCGCQGQHGHVVEGCYVPC